MMEELVIYHNGECSKCRGALEILQERGVPHTVRWYLTDPLSREELTSLLKKLELPAASLVRTTEELFENEYAGKDVVEDQWIDILLEHPGLMQRPVVEKGDKAIIARPPERVFEIIGEHS